MKFRFKLIFLLGMFVLTASNFVLGIIVGEDNFYVTVSGIVQQVANDKSFVIVDGLKIFTTPDFIDYSSFAVKDKVELTVHRTEYGLAITDLKYVLDESPQIK